MNVDLVVFVFLQDLICVFISVEGVHKDERHVGIVGFVQMLKEYMQRRKCDQSFGLVEQLVVVFLCNCYLDLLHRQIQEGVLIADADKTLRALAAHAGSQATVQFNYGKLVEAGGDVVRETLGPDLLIGLDLKG